jgi:hypothetical protein
VQQQWADVGVQIARTEGDIALLEARIAQKEGRPVGRPTIPVGPFSRPVDLNMAVPVVTGVMFVLALPLSLAWARRILRGAPQPAPLPSDLTMRLERMEHAVDAIAIEVERVSEGQRFVTKVLAQRPATPASSADAMNPAQKPPLALGAGPMEPIVVAERERVRERSVTPH